jgi:NADPH:quinone reductase-like Zn-dependent oxidoreductase
MRIYRIEAFTGPAGLAVSRSETPRPGPSEALVRVHASSLNFRDGLILQGAMGAAVPAGRIPLSDAAGEIVQVGERVARFKVGDRVMPVFNPRWIGGKRPADESPLGLGGDVDGTLRDFMVVAEEALTPIPDHLAFEEAASLPCAAVTAWTALVMREPLCPGETVLTLGTGGVAIFALQLAKLFGARVISTTSSDAKAECLKALGADETINYTATPDWDQEVRRLTDGRGADLIVEVGGAGTLGRSFRSAHANSRIAIVGLLAGASGGEGFDYMSWIASTYRTAVGSRQDFEQMNKAIGYHKLRPVLDRTFAFEDAPAAYEYFLAQKHFGKVVIKHA